MQNQLLEKIMQFNIGSENDALSFCDRLCRENVWSKTYADRCVVEYKRFLYLASVSDQQITPSDQIDQVWHLHLTYTKSYWFELCQGLLNCQLHHEPTKGGLAESKRFKAQYQATLDKYVDIFGENPPKDIWPNSNRRFKHVDQFVRVNKARYWFFKKPPVFLLPLLTSSLLLVACTQDNGESGIWFYLKVVFGVYIAYKMFNWLNEGGKGKGSKEGEGGNGIAGEGCESDHDGGGSGCGGCGGCGG